MSAVRRHFHGAAGVGGPLLYLRRTREVALGEWVEIAAPGQAPWRGQVIDAGKELSVIQVLEECGAIEACADDARMLVEQGWARLEPLIEDSLAKMMLRAFGWFALERHY